MGCPWIPLDCPGAVVDAVAGEVAERSGNVVADMIAVGCEWVFRELAGWWITLPSAGLGSSPAAEITALVRPVALLVGVAGFMWQGLMMCVSRKRDPLIGIGRGLVSLTVMSAVGLAAAGVAVEGSDRFAQFVLQAGTDGQAAVQFARLGQLAGMTQPGVVLVFGVVLMLAGIVQAVVMVFREASLVVLAGLAPLAGAGGFTNGTRPWLHRWLSRTLALVVYKPVAALIYMAAFRTVGTANGLHSAVIGLAMMATALLALPVLMRIFEFAIPSQPSGGGGGVGQLAGLATTALYAARAAGGPVGPVVQAAVVTRDLAGPGGLGTPPSLPRIVPPVSGGGL